MAQRFPIGSNVFDPETIELMRGCLEDAWDRLTPYQQSKTLKSDLATRILQAVANGERDKVRLRTHALLRVAIPQSDIKSQPDVSPR